MYSSNNFLLMADSYKVSHSRLYPKDLQYLYAYVEARGGELPNTVFFGLQGMLTEYFDGCVFTQTDITDAADFWGDHFGRRDVFDEEAWRHLYAEHGGRLPILIKAVPEGTIMPIRNVLLTVENTDPQFPWLVTWIETMLLKLWYPITIASQSHYLRQTIREIGLNTSDDIDAVVDFMVHDFGYRGVSSEETAGIGGAAHLLSFLGTDTVAGIRYLQDFYYDPLEVFGERKMYGFSIPATEHSIIMTHETERDAFAHFLDVYPEGTVACVSDTNDIYKAVTELWGKDFKEQLTNRKGRLVVRPDSGDPEVVVPRILQELATIFGFTMNRHGYKVLPDFVRVIQGDGMTVKTIPALYRTIVTAGFAPDNLVTGSGGGLLQAVTRDTMKFAYKPSYAGYSSGVTRDVSKNPMTDSSKQSKAGKFAVIYHDEKYETVKETAGIGKQNLLQPIYENGNILDFTNVTEIRNRMRGKNV